MNNWSWVATGGSYGCCHTYPSHHSHSKNFFERLCFGQQSAKDTKKKGKAKVPPGPWIWDHEGSQNYEPHLNDQDTYNLSFSPFPKFSSLCDFLVWAAREGHIDHKIIISIGARTFLIWFCFRCFILRCWQAGILHFLTPPPFRFYALMFVCKSPLNSAADI